MAGDRSRYGLLLSALGAVLLAISVFLPWYGVSLTSTGVAFAQNEGAQAIARYGNSELQAYIAPLHSSIGALAGVQLAALSAHQSLKDISVVLLILAGLALLDSLFPLVRAPSLPSGAGASLVLVGLVAAVCVVVRMVVRPDPAGEFLALSLREGAWLALAGSLMVLAGGLWPRARVAPPASDPRVESAWAGLSGWSPEG